MRLKKIFTFFTSLFHHAENAERNVARGSVVLIVGRFALKGVYFVRTIVLAHLLFPDDFGVFGLASLMLGVTSAFFTSGLNASFVQSRDDSDKYLDSIWTVNIIRNSLLGLLVFILAPFAGDFFVKPEIVSLIRVLSLSYFIAGFENVGILLYQKNLNFNKKFLYDFSIVLLETVLVIVAGFVLKNAWALVIGAVGNRFIGVVLSYVFHPYRPKFTSNFSSSWKLYRYGKWVSISAIFSFFISQGDNLVIGKLLNTTELGFYQLAFTLAFLPSLEFARVMGNILFPLFAKIQHDQELLRRSFVRVSRIIFVVVTPMSFGLFAVTSEFVSNIYGEQWLPMISIIKILLIYGLFRSFEFIMNPLLMGIGEPKIPMYAQIIQFVFMFGCIVPFTVMYGVNGTALAVVVGGLASMVYLGFMLSRRLSFGLKTFVSILDLSTIASIVMLGLLLLVKDIHMFEGLGGLFLYIILGGVFYVSGLYILDRFYGKTIMQSFLWLRKNL